MNWVRLSDGVLWIFNLSSVIQTTFVMNGFGIPQLISMDDLEQGFFITTGNVIVRMSYDEYEIFKILNG